MPAIDAPKIHPLALASFDDARAATGRTRRQARSPLHNLCRKAVDVDRFQTGLSQGPTRMPASAASEPKTHRARKGTPSGKPSLSLGSFLELKLMRHAASRYFTSRFCKI